MGNKLKRQIRRLKSCNIKLLVLNILMAVNNLAISIIDLDLSPDMIVVYVAISIILFCTLIYYCIYACICIRDINRTLK